MIVWRKNEPFHGLNETKVTNSVYAKNARERSKTPVVDAKRLGNNR